MSCFKKLLILTFTIILLLVSAACVETSADIGKATDEVKTVELTVSAAASLKDAMAEIKSEYEKEKENVSITINFGSSGSLQQQIEQGADADVFVSAAAGKMDALQEKGLIIEETRKDFLENKIVLIVPSDSAGITSFEDLLSDDVKQIGLGEPKSVPAGQYAAEVLTNLNLMDSVAPKAVYGKDVKEVLAWVETGNADAGMVYSTDAKISEKVKMVMTAPDGSHKPIYYPAAVIKATKKPEDAKEFVDFLYGSEAKPIFEKYGFKFMID